MRRPRRPSRPRRSARRRSRGDTTWGWKSRIGTVTRRPSVVTTTAMARRSGFSKKPKRPDSRCPPCGGSAQSSGRMLGNATTRTATFRGGRRPTARKWRDRRSPGGLLIGGTGACRRSPPALLRLGVHGQYHRMPAPTLRAIAASAATTQVKRARFAFTVPTPLSLATSRPRQPGGLPVEDPWLCVPASRRVCPGRELDGGVDRLELNLGGGGPLKAPPGGTSRLSRVGQCSGAPPTTETGSPGGGARRRASVKPPGPDTARPPVARRSPEMQHGHGARWLPPALAGLDDEGRAGEGRQHHDRAEGLSPKHALHGQPHRMPAPRVRAMAASIITAKVKRARFAFTDTNSFES